MARGPMSDSHKEKIRRALIGRKITWADKISLARAGQHPTDEARFKMSLAKKNKPGRPLSDENKAKLIAANKGRIFSNETLAKMSASQKKRFETEKPYWLGIKRGPQSEEWRRNIAFANKGKPAHFPNRRYYYKGVPFRSSWEMFVAQAFDKRGIKWEWEAKQFELDKTETYRPDFYLPEQDCFWEVKGWFGPMAKQTITKFRKRYPEIALVVANEDVIRHLDHSFDPRARVHPTGE